MTARNIGRQGKLNPESQLELGKHISSVEYAPEADETDGDSDDSDEEY